MRLLHLRFKPALATVMVLTAGCATVTNQVRPTTMIHESFRASPQAYRRVEIAPVWFAAAAYCDSSLSTNELRRIACEAGQKTAAAVARVFTNRGYQVVGEMRVLCREDDLASLDADTRQLLNEVRDGFWLLARDIRRAAGAEVPSLPFRYKLKAPLLQLQGKLGAPQADALVLVDSTVFLETPAGQRERTVWNWTGAPLANTALFALALGGLGMGGAPSGGTAMRSPAAIEHTLAIVDPRTQDVLLWSSVLAPGADVREPRGLNATTYDLLTALPLVAQPTKDRAIELQPTETHYEMDQR